MRQKLKPLLEKYKVDLVMQGHDHTYCRGRGNSVSSETEVSPVYVVSVAGPKANTVNPVTWSVKTGSGLQLYQHISVSGDSLNYTSWTANGVLFDSFLLVKNNLQGFTVIENNAQY